MTSSRPSFRLLLLFLATAVSASALAKLPDASKIDATKFDEVNAAVESFRKNTVGASPEFRKEAIAKLRAVIDKYPDLKAISEKLGTVNPADNVRIALAGDDQVKFIVFDRFSGKEVYSLNTSRSQANYYKSGLESNPAKSCLYGCSIIDGQQ